MINEPCTYTGIIHRCEQLTNKHWAYDEKLDQCLEVSCPKPERKNLYSSYSNCASTCKGNFRGSLAGTTYEPFDKIDLTSVSLNSIKLTFQLCFSTISVTNTVLNCII